jgi:hypothetical protein
MSVWQTIIQIASSATLEMPALEVSLLLIILSLCLMTKYSKTGLLVAYAFSYKWGWTVFVSSNESLLLVYLIFGVATGILTTVGMLFAKHQG